MRKTLVPLSLISLLSFAAGCSNATRHALGGCPVGCTRCDSQKGCQDCTANTPFCTGDVAIACNSDGTVGATLKTCDATNNEHCQGGTCLTPCDVAAQTHSYIGCDYWPVTLLNAELDPRFNFAVAVANPLTVSDVVTNPTANVTVSRGGDQVITATVGPGEVKVIKLDWVSELSQNGMGEQSIQVSAGAYHLVSTLPVTVYQFNPLQYQKARGPNDPHCQQQLDDLQGVCHSYTNDASILLPATALQKDYYVMARQTYALLQAKSFQVPNPQPTSTPGFLAAVATENNTTVTVTFSAYTGAGLNMLEQKPGDVQTYSLDKGDVLQIVSKKALPPSWDVNNPKKPCVSMTKDALGSYCDLGKDYDLTGSKVSADKPIAVFGGHSCSFVPYNKWACDHLEEQMFPLNTWGKQVLGVQTPPQTPGEVNTWRVMSGIDGNMITFDPAVAKPAKLNTGDYIEFTAENGFQATGTGRLLVAQYMVGENYVDLSLSVGDPSLGLAVPVEQYRKSYDFYSPDTYQKSSLSLIGKLGSSITLDQQVMNVAANQQIGKTDYGYVWIDLMPGAHHISSDKPFGIAVSGVGAYTSYLYPGGLNLNELLPQ